MSLTYGKVKTGIPGLDSITSGGFRQGRTLVLTGDPGSGKTTFGLQFLHSGAKDFDEPGVYVSLAQSLDEIKNDCKSFGLDLQNMVQKEKLLMMDARMFKISDESVEKDDSLYRGEQIPFEHLTKLILKCIKRIGAKRVVIDSVSILMIQYEDQFYLRQGLQGLIQALENSGVTTLLISESPNGQKPPMEWYEASGIIQLQYSRKQDTMERSIQIIKMRGVKHSEQIHPISFGSDGLQILRPRLMI
jgi:circadian clock protein KaiC